MEKSNFSSTFALAFGKPIALTNDLVVVEATAASALPTHSRSSYLPSVERLFRGVPVKRAPILLTTREYSWCQ